MRCGDSPVSGLVSAAKQTGETGCGELFIVRQSVVAGLCPSTLQSGAMLLRTNVQTVNMFI